MSLPGFTAEKSIGEPLFNYVSNGGASFADMGNVQMMWGLGSLKRLAKKAVREINPVKRLGGLVGGRAGCVIKIAGRKALKCLPRCGTSPSCWARCVGFKTARRLVRCF